MIDRWRPGQRSRSGDEARVGTLALPGPELDRIGRRVGDGEFAPALEGDDRAIEPDVDLDLAAGIAPVAAPRPAAGGPDRRGGSCDPGRRCSVT